MFLPYQQDDGTTRAAFLVSSVGLRHSGTMDSRIETATFRRVYWRLVPLLFTLMFFNYLDRVNVGFAALRMNGDLGFSATVYGLGATIFFAGYVVLQVPSNLIVYRLGARRWLAGLLFAWGSISAATAFIQNASGFYTLRFTLGLTEAGFLPAAALYATYWFPEKYRGRAISGYIIATSCSTVIGGPIATALMTWLDRVLGLHGWQWMFLAEGIPATLLGFFVLHWLTDRPENAHWLEPDQRQWLVSKLATEKEVMEREEGSGTWAVLRTVLFDPRVWNLGLAFGAGLVGLYGLLLWLPQIIKEMGALSDLEVGFLSTVSPLLGIAGALFVSYRSDRKGNRKAHMAACYVVAGAGLLASTLIDNPVAAFFLLSIGNAAVLAASPLFWAIGGSFFTGAAAAACVAVANIIAQIGGIGPWLIGRVKDATGSFTLALIAISIFFFVAAGLALAMRPSSRPQISAAPAE
jgi:sugar phosphate permease